MFEYYFRCIRFHILLPLSLRGDRSYRVSAHYLDIDRHPCVRGSPACHTSKLQSGPRGHAHHGLCGRVRQRLVSTSYNLMVVYVPTLVLARALIYPHSLEVLKHSLVLLMISCPAIVRKEGH